MVENNESVGEYSQEGLDASMLKREASRREFLKSGLKALLAAGAIGSTTYYVSGYGKERLLGIIAEAEREIRGLAIDVKALSGSVEKRLRKERVELERHYESGRLRILEEAGIADPAEISELESIIRTNEEFERHYNIVERLRIFKDRIDRRLLNLDDRMEEYHPSWLKKINDSIRGIFSKKSGEEGERVRDAIRSRLDLLCKIYDANENSRIAMPKVMERINHYLGRADLSDEERQLFEFLKEEFRDKEKAGILRDFIMNYNNYSDRNYTLLRLRASLTEAERVYDRIKENRTYIERLQGLLKKGIALKQEVREKGMRDLRLYRTEFQKRMSELMGEVDDMILELKDRGYDIETREDYIKKGKYARMISDMFDSIMPYCSAALGAIAGFFTYRFVKRGKDKRIRDKALERAVIAYNGLLERYKNLRRDKDKNEG